jgi:hypothetical protein
MTHYHNVVKRTDHLLSGVGISGGSDGAACHTGSKTTNAAYAMHDMSDHLSGPFISIQ